MLNLILSRSSTKKFADTPVARDVVEQLLAAAARAPDHGVLAPWRFTVLAGESRKILSEAMKAALQERSPSVDAETLAREGSKALRSPVLIVVSAVTQAHPKVPEVEQLVAVGAAIQNLWLAALSVGLGVAWKTGSHAYHPAVKGALGIDTQDHIIGFIHLGVPVSSAPLRPAEFASRTRWL